LLLAVLGRASSQGKSLPTIELRPGLVITQSVRIAPRVYDLEAPASIDSAVVTIRGDDITVDFAGATMEGQAPDADPDRAHGVGIRIESGRNILIRHARIRGYSVGILARGTRKLSLVGNDLSYNWKPRLYSGIEHESLVDWLSFHHNEKEEWLRYGAGIYLSDVDSGEVSDNTVRQGMNGLMLVRTSGLRIWNNDFSFNSGVGIGLYRSTHNAIMHNRVDYNVRGYSEGFYRRGQDAADLLIYEQSDSNVVAYNSMTHGGDGVFLWAGQSTMDTGDGGANGNLFFGNDFSFAPANGIEATFSRNDFFANLVEGNEYGLWGGYSSDSRIVGNRFERNRTGVAIEHGQNNLIAANIFLDDSMAIRTWADPIEPSAWGYPRHRDTRSRDYNIDGNVFVGNMIGVRASATSRLTVANNRFVGVDSTASIRDSTRYTFIRNRVDSVSAAAARVALPPQLPLPPELARLRPARIPHGWMPARADTALARLPRSAIVVDEWGPYDYRSPKLWPLDSVRANPLRLRVLGPPGSWRLAGQRGVDTVSKSSGRVGDTITVTPRADSLGDWEVVLEYTGRRVISPRGVPAAAGEPYRFSFSRFEPRMNWSTKFYIWTDSTGDPRIGDGFASLVRSPSIVNVNVSRLDYEGYRALPGLPRENFALEATAAVDLPPGEYTLRTISDDAIRVFVDGVAVIDDWKPHESTVHVAPLSGGHHDLRVDYYQGDGWYELRVDIVRGRVLSTGSPGAHSAD
jgi:parallel beta-helix repeat protein